jgi:hypothetical protein
LLVALQICLSLLLLAPVEIWHIYHSWILRQRHASRIRCCFQDLDSKSINFAMHASLDRHKFSTNRFVRNFLQLTYKIDMCPLAFEKHMLFANSMFYLHAFLIALIKKNYTSHMFKWHMSFLYVGCRKFSTNQFVENLCP